MFKRIIKFKKKYILPYFWYMTRRKEIANTTIKDIESILDKRDAIKARLIEVERINDVVLTKVEEGRLKLINWIIQKYGNPKS